VSKDVGKEHLNQKKKRVTYEMEWLRK